MILQTERLILRRITMDDAERITSLLEDGEVNKTTQNIPYPYTIDLAEDWIKLHDYWFNNNINYVFGVILKESNDLIGVVSCTNNDLVGEIGYWYGTQYWNFGYGTEAAEVFLEWLFMEKNFEKVYGRFLVTNRASGRIMQKIGMTQEGTLRKHLRKGRQYVDLDVYGMLREEFISKLENQ